MKSGDMPVYPIQDSAETGGTWPLEALHHSDCNGLTKREAFAMAAMQGLLSADEKLELDENVTAQLAVQRADALLAELEA